VKTTGFSHHLFAWLKKKMVGVAKCDTNLCDFF
jgi:hypothetical protein